MRLHLRDHISHRWLRAVIEARVDLAFELLQVSETHAVRVTQREGNLLLGLGHIRLVLLDSLSNFARFLLVNKSVPTLRFRNGLNHVVLCQVLLIDTLSLGVPAVGTTERVQVLAWQVEAVIESQVQLGLDLEVV